MSEFEFTFVTDDALKRLRSFGRKTERSAARKAARQGMNIVRNAARKNARALDDPDTKLRIWRDIVTQESRRQSKAVGGVVMRVGVRGGARGADRPYHTPWYWRLQELGTQHHRAQPFMVPALEQNAEAVGKKVADVLNAEIDKLVGPGVPTNF